VIDIDDIRDRDAEAHHMWFTGPASFTALAARDRRALLHVIDELRERLGETEPLTAAVRIESET
jgi:hypothetical protein